MTHYTSKAAQNRAAPDWPLAIEATIRISCHADPALREKHLCSSSQAAEPKKQLHRSFASTSRGSG
jgi:hypothetical protein